MKCVYFRSKVPYYYEPRGVPFRMNFSQFFAGICTEHMYVACISDVQSSESFDDLYSNGIQTNDENINRNPDHRINIQTINIQ